MLIIRIPPMFKSFTTKFRFIRSGPAFQRNLKKGLSIVFKRFPRGFGKAENKFKNFANSNDFITVTLPKSVNLRLDQCFITCSTLFSTLFVFMSQISKTSVVKTTLRILKGP